MKYELRQGDVLVAQFSTPAEVSEASACGLIPEGLDVVAVPSADDVRAEASRRMQALVGARNAEHLAIIIANGSREAIRLLRIKAERPWTSQEAIRAVELEDLDVMLDAIRAASNAMEPSPPIDFQAPSRWPWPRQVWP